MVQPPLIRFYGFTHGEIVPDTAASASGMRPLHIDPKLAWALAHRVRFRVDINCAPWVGPDS